MQDLKNPRSLERQEGVIAPQDLACSPLHNKVSDISILEFGGAECCAKKWPVKHCFEW